MSQDRPTATTGSSSARRQNDAPKGKIQFGVFLAQFLLKSPFMPTAADLDAAIRDVPDFPKSGILFKDITPILGDPDLFKASLELLAETAGGEKIDKVVGSDARGFIFAAGVALILGAGFVPVRNNFLHMINFLFSFL